MARVLLAPSAITDLDRLITTHSLPAGTAGMVARSIEPLGQLPLLGASLEGRWLDCRFILGPWRWMLIVYSYDDENDVVAIVSVHDATSSAASTAVRAQ